MRIFTKGNRVTQPQYGPGTITSTDEQYTIIEFDNHGTRTFVTNMVRLEATSEPAPAKAAQKRRASAAKGGSKATKKKAESSPES